MGGVPTSFFRRLGALPPLRLGLLFAAGTSAAAGPRIVGARGGAPGLVELGAVVRAAIALLLWVVVTWHRDDDALAAGVLLAATLTAGGLLADAVVTVAVTGSAGAHAVGARGARGVGARAWPNETLQQTGAERDRLSGHRDRHHRRYPPNPRPSFALGHNTDPGRITPSRPRAT